VSCCDKVVVRIRSRALVDTKSLDRKMSS
jgi:hypothetical protein